MNLSTQNPLETLVIAQLASLRRHETQLRQEFQSPAGSDTSRVAAQLFELQQRTDRLNRMIDAMGINNARPAFSFGSATAA